MLAQSLGPVQIIVVLVYLLLVGYLGWLGYRRTKTASDYMVAGRQTHPFVMAMSYGATFISTSAIVGFGGLAGWFGMSLMWLTFLNILMGIFIAFVVFGGQTRRMGHHLDAHTFPELIGRRYDSRSIQVFAGLVIFIFMPLYAAAVLIGGAEFICKAFEIDYNVALLVFALVVAAYVMAGGLKAVMYTDALQGIIMFFGMVVLLVATYMLVGGVSSAHSELTKLGEKPNLFNSIGFKGWTSMPEFGWGAKATPKGPNNDAYNLWWLIVSSITLGVGVGVLAQPQLAVRFMTVKSKRELNRAVCIGAVFILVMVGVTYTVGSLSNLYFANRESLKGTLVSVTGTSPEKADWVTVKEERGLNLKPDGTKVNPAIGDDEKAVPCMLLHLDTTGTGKADTTLVYKGHGGVAAIMPNAIITELAPGADPAALVGQTITVRPCATALTRAIVERNGGRYGFNTDSVIPTFITRAMPKWFGLLFLLTLLAAAMSTLSGQFHALGTSIGRDVYEQLTGRHGQSLNVTRAGIIVGLVLAVTFGVYARGGYIIARATAIFFGLCASAFLPTFVGGLFWKRATRPAAIASMAVGFATMAFWLLFIKDQEARAIGLCKALFGKYSLLLDHPSWPVVDPLIIALPLSTLVFVAVTLLSRPPAADHVCRCFANSQSQRPV